MTPRQVRRPLGTEDLMLLRLLANGASDRELARAMFRGETTVRSRLKRIRRVLGARDRAHAVALALRLGLISPDAVALPQHERRPA